MSIELIDEQIESLQAQKDELEKEAAKKGPWYNIAGFGNEGCEILLSSKDDKYVSIRIRAIELRARINSHRNIRVYKWASDKEVTWGQLKTKKQIKSITDNAECIY
jgi:hypothetical protein